MMIVRLSLLILRYPPGIVNTTVQIPRLLMRSVRLMKMIARYIIFIHVYRNEILRYMN